MRERHRKKSVNQGDNMCKCKMCEGPWWIFFHKLGEMNVSPECLTGLL